MSPKAAGLLQGTEALYLTVLILQKGETESLQKRMRDADNVLSEKMALTRQVMALQVILSPASLTVDGTGR